MLDGGGADAVIVVDNGGDAVVPDGVELLQPGRNGGFGAAANVGFGRARDARGDGVRAAQRRRRRRPGWLAPLVAELAGGQRVGAVQPKLLIAGTARR